MISQTLLADLGVMLLIKPFNDGVFDFTYSLEICEILLELVAIWCHVLDSIVVADVFLVR